MATSSGARAAKRRVGSHVWPMKRRHDTGAPAIVGSGASVGVPIALTRWVHGPGARRPACFATTGAQATASGATTRAHGSRSSSRSGAPVGRILFGRAVSKADSGVEVWTCVQHPSQSSTPQHAPDVVRAHQHAALARSRLDTVARWSITTNVRAAWCALRSARPERWRHQRGNERRVSRPT
jgi:hypothetical protein